MVALLFLGLLLLATAVVPLARGLMAARLRATDNLIQIGHYGYTGTAVELEPADGARGFIDSTAASVGTFLTERLNLVNEDRLRKTLVAAGMYGTSPRT